MHDITIETSFNGTINRFKEKNGDVRHGDMDEKRTWLDPLVLIYIHKRKLEGMGRKRDQLT